MKRPIERAAFLLFAALTVLGCRSAVNPRVATRINTDASLIGDLPVNPLANRIITTWVDHQTSTTSILYGNDLAVRHARQHLDGDYPTGSILSLVTWNQQEDPRWFGGKIPSTPRSVEYVTVTQSPQGFPSYAYESYQGSPLKKASSQQDAAHTSRVPYLLSRHAALMP